MSNVQAGSEFEEEMVSTLGKNGFWASLFPKSKDGSQPCDIIALNELGAHLIDAKDCKNGRFPFSRIEDNQRNSMDRFLNLRCGKCYFALKYPDNKVYMIAWQAIRRMMDDGHKSINTIPEVYSLENWLNANRIKR